MGTKGLHADYAVDLLTFRSRLGVGLRITPERPELAWSRRNSGARGQIEFNSSTRSRPAAHPAQPGASDINKCARTHNFRKFLVVKGAFRSRILDICRHIGIAIILLASGKQ